MKILSSDFRKGPVKVKIETKDDLWYLSQIIDPGDWVKGATERKIKLGDGTDRNVKVIRKKVFLEIKVEKTELNESLRVLGKITQGPDDISLGSHHSFDLSENDTITINKQWLKFQTDKLKESTKASKTKILIVIFDREEAYFAKLDNIGLTNLTHISGNVTKKNEENVIKDNFYQYLIKTTEEYDKKYNFGKIICASPAFWKEELAKNLNNSKITQKIIFSTCSSVDKRAFNEVLKRPEIRQALSDERTTREINLVEDLLTQISKDMAVYGFKEVKSALEIGAIRQLLVSISLIEKLRSNGDYEKLDSLMKTADSMKAEISIIDKNNEAGKKLDGIGGIGAMLRYKI